jgi:hypothetical protein
MKLRYQDWYEQLSGKEVTMSGLRSGGVIMGVVIMVLTASQSAFASGSAGQVRVGAFLGTGWPEYEDVNGTINDLAAYFQEATDWPGYTDHHFDTDELGGGWVFGGWAEYLVTDNLALGVEFMPLSSDGGFDYGYAYDYDDGESVYSVGVAGDADYEATAGLMSIYGLYLLPMGDTPVTLRLGAGLGYLSGASLTMDFVTRYTVDLQEIEMWSENLKASGSAAAFHGLVGAEYEVTDHLLLCANAVYRKASVDELEVENVEGDEYGWFSALEKGETLKWHRYEVDEAQWAYEFSTEKGDNIGLDFGGFYLTVSAAFVFGP